MSSVIEVSAEDEERQLRSSLLHRSSHSAPHSVLAGETRVFILPSVSSNNHSIQSPPPNRRLASLDAFRGLTVAKISSKSVATQKVIMRTVKLFLLGLLLQGGYFHGRKHLTFGIDVSEIRWMGVLQRISIGYFLASISEIWLVKSITVDSPVAFVRKYYIQWLVQYTKILTLIFFLVDVKKLRKPMLLLQWMGLNALILYALAACELFPIIIQGFYWRSPENNLVDATESLLQYVFHSRRWGTLVFVLLEILFWCILAGFLHMKNIYIKM